jgi:hypothetical protein
MCDYELLQKQLPLQPGRCTATNIFNSQTAGEQKHLKQRILPTIRAICSNIAAQGYYMHEENTNNTRFASADRASQEQVLVEHQSIMQSELVQSLIHSMQDMVLILNEQRQIIAANKSLTESLGVSDPTRLLGKRPGEALGCTISLSAPAGCGTAEACSVCGAVLAILASQSNRDQRRGTCHINLEKNGGTALDLSVMASPLNLEGHGFTIFSLRDTSADQRRQVLERVFFHDILNTAGGIRGLAALLNEDIPQEKETRFKQWMLGLSDSLIDDITNQRRLMAAERGDLHVVMETFHLQDLLQELACLYEHHDRTPQRTTRLIEHPACLITTDRAILRRIIGNMILNALEASHTGGMVTIATQLEGKQVRISVTNKGEIARDVQLQLFKRSFSTKTTNGRGIGTYSMKLFGERYLDGNIGFNSSNGRTTFYIELPLSPAKAI